MKTKITLMLMFFISLINAQIREVSLEEKINHATEILEVRKISEYSDWDKDKHTIYTFHKMEVINSFKGTQESVITLVTQGGTVNDETISVCPNSVISEETNMIVMLVQDYRNSTSTNVCYRPYADSQSEFLLKDDKVISTFDQFDGNKTAFYNYIMSKTKNRIAIKEESKNSQKMSQATAIDPIIHISPTTITAGTGEVLTITGSGFGTSQGAKKIGFRDANSYAEFWSGANGFTVISWTDTEIKIRLHGTQTLGLTPGTGKIQMREYGSAPAIYSQETLVIRYSVIEAGNDLPLRHYDQNGNGGMTFTLNTQVAADLDLKNRFTEALDYWTCEANINWNVSDTTTSIEAFNSNDGVNAVFFSSTLSAGVLAQCSTVTYSTCPRIIKSLDIVINSTVNWNKLLTNPASNQSDLMSTLLHELGHGGGLNHIVNSSRTMNLSIGNGTTRRVLHQDEVDAGLFVQNLSVNQPLCGYSAMTNGVCLGLANENFETSHIAFHPNPTHDFVTLDKEVESVKVYTILGQQIFPETKVMATQTQIDFSNFPTGVYLIETIKDGAKATSKIIKE